MNDLRNDDAGLTREQLDRLKDAARAASERAYVPYSKFRVGAAVLAEQGEVIAGCNVENASYGLTCCAERATLFSAVAAGKRNLRALLLYTPTPQRYTPCGACRQVIAELAPQAKVICVCDSEESLVATPQELLPASFSL